MLNQLFRNTARYEYTHEVLGRSEIKWDGITIERGRRIALLFRDDPCKQ